MVAATKKMMHTAMIKWWVNSESSDGLF